MLLANELTLSIRPGQDMLAEELESLTQQLVEEVAELDIGSVDLFRSGETPQRAKVGDPVTWGTLLVALVASRGVLTTLISAVETFVSTHERCSVTLNIGGDKLEIKGMRSAERKELIDAWLSHFREVDQEWRESA